MEINYKFIDTNPVIEIPSQPKRKDCKLQESNYAVASQYVEEGLYEDEVINGSCEEICLKS